MNGINNKKILVVDDEKEICETVALFLESYGATVFQANNGQEAFEFIKKEYIDFVITDVKMPGGDGVGLLENIRAYNDKIPTVLMVTGFADISKKEAIEKGAIDLLSKPVDYDVLIKYIENHI